MMPRFYMLLGTALLVQACTHSPAPKTGAETAGAIEPSMGLIDPSRIESVDAAVARPPGPFHLNFVDVELPTVARAILAEILGVNYLIDPGVKGRITVQTTTPVTQQMARQLFERALDLNGAALIETDGIWMIMPKSAGRSSVQAEASSEIAESNGPSLLDRIPLSYASAAEVKEVVRSILGPEDEIQVDQRRNALLLSTASEKLDLVKDIVATLDVDALDDMSMSVVELEHAPAAKIADELVDVFGEAFLDLLSTNLRIIPLERLNLILVLAQEDRDAKRVLDWISLLDQQDKGGSRRLWVYEVENGRAADLASLVSGLLDSSQSSSRHDDEVIDVSLAPNLQPVEIQSAALEGGASSNAMPAPPTAASGAPPSLDTLQHVRVIADEPRNSLVVLGTAEEFQLLKEAFARLDRLPLQVLIEATIIEVTLNDSLRYGLQWFFKSGDFETRLSEVGSGDAASLFPGFSSIFQSSADVRVVLNALETLSDVNVLSSPQLMVLDNETAVLQVGDQVPVAVQQAQSTTQIDAPIVNTIEFRDTGVILNVTPRVNSGGLTFLDIEQEVSDVVSTNTSGIDSPTISQRRIGSTVAVHSGETVALGGLIREGRTQTSDGVPFLSRIPIIGWLFGSKTSVTARTELIVLITPRVIRDLEDARAATDELRRQMRGILPASATH